MNEYFSAISSDNPSAEQPNDWAKMLMSVANQNNVWSAEQAQKQMDFQREMSNTAHQREIADLKAAGLNPVLSARLGGASTPTGAAGTADSSIVSSLVSLMDKMLDVQGTSAAAAYNASGGSNATYGNGSDGSAIGSKSISDSKGNNFEVSDYYDPLNTLKSVFGSSGSFTQNDFKFLGKYAPSVASFFNGMFGMEDVDKNNSPKAHALGEKNQPTYVSAEDIIKSGENADKWLKDIYNKASMSITNAKQGAGAFVNWLTTGDKNNSVVTSAVKNAAKNVATSIKNIFSGSKKTGNGGR